MSKLIEKYTRFFRLSLKRLVKEKNITPHSIAMGFAVGIFAAFTPFVGFQIILSLTICIILKYNKLAGFIGVFASNPITFFPIYFFTYHVGLVLFGNFFENAMELNNIENSIREVTSFEQILDFGFSTIAVFLLGCILVGIVAAVVSYFIAKAVILYYRNKRMNDNFKK